jgi:hypothetical protein
MLIDCAKQIRFKETLLVHFNQLGKQEEFYGASAPVGEFTV